MKLLIKKLGVLAHITFGITLIVLNVEASKIQIIAVGVIVIIQALLDTLDLHNGNQDK
jgi:hypothetical protein